MSEAEYLAQLRQKESEKKAVMEELKAIGDDLEKNHKGKVHVEIVDLKQYSLTSFEIRLKDNTVSGSGTKAEATFSVETKEVEMILSFTARKKIPDSATTTTDGDVTIEQAYTFNAILDCSILPSSTFLTTELEAMSSDGLTCTLSIRGSYDSYEGLINSKQLEIQQINQEIDEIKEAVKKFKEKNKIVKKDVKKTSAIKPKKTVSKRGSSSSSSSNNVIKSRDGHHHGTSVFSMKSLQQGVMMTGMLLIHHRSYILFGISAMGIYMYGDYISA